MAMNAFDALEGLLTLQLHNVGIGEFFRDNDIRSVILYGLGRVGIQTYDALIRAGIEVPAVLDRNAESIETDAAPVYPPERVGELEAKAELIVVTPMDYYYEIKEELETRTKLDIISIAEIVEYCKEGEPFSRPQFRRRASPKKKEPPKAVKAPIDRLGRSRSVLIFGGGSGIGKAVALRLLQNEGTKVTIAGRGLEKLERVRGEAQNENLFVLQADISKVREHGQYFESARSLMGACDAFVNSAAISLESRGRGYEPWDITEEEWDEVSDVDFKGIFFLMRNEIDFFRSNRIGGNILNFSSNAACMDIIGLYGASKLAVMRWTKAFGKRFGHEGIVINGIAPGATYTPIISSYAKRPDQPYPRHAIERFILPEEIAALANYCLSDAGVILCGSTITADGGDAEAFV